MTKTLLRSYRFEPNSPHFFGKTEKNNDSGKLFWSFEFRSLRFIWDLVFGAWNFHFLAPSVSLDSIPEY
jgi:hypothetical protein